MKIAAYVSPRRSHRFSNYVAHHALPSKHLLNLDIKWP
jgi:hypothetical protein